MRLLVLFVLYSVALSLLLAFRGFRRRTTPSARDRVVVPEKTSLRLLIVGATGGTGRELVAQALERGHRVTALVRNPAKLAVQHPNLAVVQGDVLDGAAVEAAVAGHDAVLSALGHKRFLGPTRILSDGARNLVVSMERHGVRRLVCETSLGIGDGAWRMGLYYTFFVIPVVLPFYFWDKARQERVIAASSLDWVIVRPGVLTNGARRSAYRHGVRVGNVLLTRRISRADVASFMIDQVTDDSYLRCAPAICG